MWTSVLYHGKKEIIKEESTEGEEEKKRKERKEGERQQGKRNKEKRGRELPVSMPSASSRLPPEIFPKVSRAPHLTSK